MLDLEDWLQTPAGVYFIDREQAWLDQVVVDLFGLRAIQLGTPQIDALRASRIPHKAYADQADVWQRQQGSSDQSPPLGLVFDFNYMPLESQSIDLVVLPHVLEFAASPHQILREVERVLLPEGRVIFTGFNPLSLWGLRHWVLKSKWPVWPLGCEPIALARLKDWLQFLALEPEMGRFGGYRFPTFNSDRLQRYQFMEHAGDRWWPSFAGAYYLCAVKRVSGMRLVSHSFKKPDASIEQFKPATQKTTHKASTMRSV